MKSAHAPVAVRLLLSVGLSVTPMYDYLQP